MQDFRNIKVWQANRRLVASIYRVTAAFPRTELYGLTSQMRRAAMSIGSSIAEGTGRSSRKDSARFLQMSLGSATELLHHLITAVDLGFLDPDQFRELDAKLLEIRKMLTSLMATLRGRRPNRREAPAKPPRSGG